VGGVLALREELSASVLIIEQVRNDPLVVASYLGTDDRAINRSDALASN
jgi:hypothetical protein